MKYAYLIITILAQLLNLSKPIKLNKNLRKLEKSDDIVIIHINDVHCYLNDSIGYDGLALYLDEIRKNYTNVLTVDVGDHIQGNVLGAISSGSAIIKLMNKIGFNVSILGNHEFDYGIDQLLKLEKNILSRYICANFLYRKNKTTVFEPFKIIEIGGKKIAFIGVVTPTTLIKTYLSTIKDEDGKLKYDFLQGNNGKDLAEAIQKYINQVKEENNADYVILLTHLGMKDEEYTSDGLLSNLEGVDAILDGHTHKIYTVTSKDKNGKDIHISQTGTKLKRIGKIILMQNDTIITENIEEIPEPFNVIGAKKVFRNHKYIWVNEEISNFIEQLWKEYDEELNIQVGYSNFDFIVMPEGGDSSTNECRIKECTLGNLLADALKDAGNAEISFLNGGSIRNNMKKGNLTGSQIINVSPYFNNIVVKEISGQAILDALEFGISEYPTPSTSFLQVSGITFDIDPNINNIVWTDENDKFINVTGKRKVFNVKINGVNLDIEKKYNASLTEYIASGGDGFSMFANFNVTNESVFTDTDALNNYIQNTLKGEIPEKYKYYQGRININNQASTKYSHYFNYKKRGGKLSAGSIVAIILSCVGALAIITLVLFFLNRNNLSPSPSSKMQIYNPQESRDNLNKN